MAKKKMWKNIAMWLVIIGAINWGLTGIGFNLVEIIADAIYSGLAQLIYIAVGVSGIITLINKLK